MAYRGQKQTNQDPPNPTLGVLLCNLGTPDAPTAQALRRYLREFLGDPRVVEIPRFIWWPILYGLILPFRPKRSAALYKSIWTEQGSPLLSISQQQADALQSGLTAKGVDAKVILGMRYGNPSIAQALRGFQAEGIERVIVLPLYPQYSGATTGATFDALADELKRWRWVPQLHFINSYYRQPGYIRALAETVRAHFAEHGKPEKLVLSYHGTPKRYFNQGDPYYTQCLQTTQALVQELGLGEAEYVTSFQSRFGKAPWLQPYTDETLRALAKDGVKHVAIICPGFSADCLETLEEIAEENREEFTGAGGATYHYIPALNAREDHIAMMAELVSGTASDV